MGETKRDREAKYLEKKERERRIRTWPRLDLKLSVDDDQLERDFSMFAYNEDDVDDVASLWTSDKVIKMLEEENIFLNNLASTVSKPCICSHFFKRCKSSIMWKYQPTGNSPIFRFSYIGWKRLKKSYAGNRSEDEPASSIIS